jgi:hypothetical protein
MFSMMMGCLSKPLMYSVTTRAITSVLPPTANGVIIVTGRDG